MSDVEDNVEVIDNRQHFFCVGSTKRHMIHGPCGRINPKAPCMKDGKCTKRFPRHLLNDTQTDVDGYPLYRRRSREEGGTFTVLHVRQMDVEIDNRWVVPYNPVLTKMFNAHIINLECCNSVMSADLIWATLRYPYTRYVL